MSQDPFWPGWRYITSSSSDFVYNFFNRVKDYTREALEHLILAVILYIVICLVLYAGIVRWNVLEFKRDVKEPKRVLIVIAHPDDECMFFGPTILNFTKNSRCLLYLMCLTTGVSKKIGKIRKNELYESCKVLGIDEASVTIQKHSLMPDSMTQRWPAELIGNMILSQVATYNIDTIITFDKHGVSRHLNHCSIYYAVANLILEKKLPPSCKIYVLETVNILRKYWMIFDIPFSYIFSRNRYILSTEDRSIVMKAMKKHASQLVWFRRLYLIFSRYTFINTLQEMDSVDIELELQIDD